jgi:Protein of unknown function (DUF1493)
MVIKLEIMDNTEVYKFLFFETGKVLNDETPNYKIQQDFNIYGDEAIDFIIRFSEKFNVKIDNFIFDDYFDPEIDKISLFILNVFRKKLSKKEFTVNSLKEAIEKGELI